MRTITKPGKFVVPIVDQTPATFHRLFTAPLAFFKAKSHEHYSLQLKKTGHALSQSASAQFSSFYNASLGLQIQI